MITTKYLSLALGLSITLTASAQTFEDVAPEMEIEVLIGDTDVGCGVSLADFDLDGWDDITFGTNDEDIRFYRNNMGVFELVFFDGITLTGNEVKMITWVDYDNDGDRDLMVGLHSDSYRFYQNQGDMTFIQLNSIETGIVTGSQLNRNICWGDYDRDGDLDVYLGKSHAVGSGILSEDYPKMNKLFRNDDGYFVDVTLEAGVSDSIGITFGTVWWDYDLDGWPDLFTANDKWFKNGIYHNNGDGTFTSVGEETGLGVVMDGMCASPADYDNDGDFDMFVTNTYLSLDNTGNALFKNNNDGTFNNVSTEVNLGLAVFQSWGGGWLDYNNDGFQDIFVSTRDILNQSPNLNRLYRSNQGNSFTMVNNQTNLGQNGYSSYAHAIGDINNDGYADIINHGSGTVPARILQNSGGLHNYIKVDLHGTASNIEGIGSIITCSSGGVIQTRYTHCGENFMAQNSFVEIFGVRNNDIVDSLIIQWPSGHTDSFYNIDVNQTLSITEGSSFSVQLSSADTITLCEGESFILEAQGFENYIWNTGDENVPLIISAPGVYFATVFNEFNVPVVSDEIIVEQVLLPQIVESVSNCSCPGLEDGTAVIINELENPYSVVWGDGIMASERTDLGPGYYSYSASTPEGCSVSGLVQITSPEELEFTTFTSGSCENENDGSILVYDFNHSVDQLVWNTELEGTELSNLSPGSYVGEISYLNSCIAELQVFVEAFPQASIESYSVADPLCHEDENGSIILVPLDGVEITDVTWSNGGNELIQEALGGGEYQVSLVNSYGCESQEMITLQAPDLLTGSIYANPILDPEDPCYQTYSGGAEVEGGTEPYEFNWTHIFFGQTTNFDKQTWTCIDQGWMALNIIDANGCIFNSSKELELIVGLNELENTDIFLYPNPANEEIQVFGLQQSTLANIYGIDGRLIRSVEINMDGLLNVSDLVSGQYILSLTSLKNHKSIAFIKQ